MDGGLLAGEEARADPRPGSPQCQRGGEPTAVCDAAGGHDRGRCHSGHDCASERQRGDGPAHVPSRLPALRHDDIDAAIDRATRLIGAPHRVQSDCTGIMRPRDQPCGITPEEGHDGDALAKTDVELFVLGPYENQVDAKRPSSERTSLANLTTNNISTLG